MSFISTPHKSRYIMAGLALTLSILFGLHLGLMSRSAPSHSSSELRPSLAAVPQQATLSSPQTRRYWIMSSTALNSVVTTATAKAALSHDSIFVIMSPKAKLVPEAQGLGLIPTVSFTSESVLMKTLNAHSLPSTIRAVLYDNEPWSLTPPNEQANPATYYQKAYQIAHQHGYIFIAAPVSKTNPSLDSIVAADADVLDIQSQFDQAVATTYAQHVLPIASAVHAVNPKTIILSGLSTNPTAGVPTPSQLVADAQAVSSSVRGYWLNIPSPGIACPQCHARRPDIGIQFLSLLGPQT